MEINRLYENCLEVIENGTTVLVFENGAEICFSPMTKVVNQAVVLGDVSDTGCWCAGIRISKDITEIRPGAFRDIEELDGDITVDNGNEYFKVIDNVLFSKDGRELIYCPPNRRGDYSVPDGTVKIVGKAFYYSSLHEVTIPESVKDIAGDAFDESGIAICGKTGGYADSYATKNGVPFSGTSGPEEEDSASAGPGQEYIDDSTWEEYRSLGLVYSVTLTGGSDNRMALINALRKALNIGVVDAKKLTEDLPKTVAKYVDKEDASYLRSLITDAGGKAAVKKISR